MNEPYERLPDESDPAWAAFQKYRDMGLTRSTGKVAQESRKHKSLMDRWSSKYRWVARASAWDVEQDRAWRAEMADRRREMANRQARIGSLAESKVAEWLMQVDPQTLSPSEASRLLEVATRLQHQVLGVPQRVEISGPDGGPMQVEGLTAEETLARLKDVQSQIAEVLGDGT
jgi:hypothetical protein